MKKDKTFKEQNFLITEDRKARIKWSILSYNDPPPCNSDIPWEEIEGIIPSIYVWLSCDKSRV